jgi:hypothetical protein
MRPEWRWILAAGVAFTIGCNFSDGYARLSVPYFAAITSLIATSHPWRVTDLRVGRDDPTSAMELRLEAQVSRRRNDPAAAIVVAGVQVGEIMEAPLVFWSLLLVWPARRRRESLLRAAFGVPIFLVLGVVTTACQLVYPMARASAMLAGADPLTAWERWSRFLEAGGSFALEVGAALVAVGLASWNRNLLGARWSATCPAPLSR